MKNVLDIPHLQGVKVLVRLPFDVPIVRGKIVDDYRIRTSEPTLDFLISKGARLILVSHIEGTDHHEGGHATLAPVAEYLAKKYKVTFVKNFHSAFKASEDLSDGECILLENLRVHEGEKKNDVKFAKELASLAEIFVNEAFSVSHRKHASIVGVTEYLPSYAGIQFTKEVEHLNTVLNPKHPFVFMLGGAKFETKLPLIEKFMEKADKVFVGGALANDFFKEAGMETGTSIISEKKYDLSRYLENPKLMLPVDVTVESFSETGERQARHVTIKNPHEVLPSECTKDAGPKTIEALKEAIKDAALVVWNGPLGAYENGYVVPTHNLAKVIAASKATTILGGGDTLAAINELGLADSFTFVSTGGGAMLDYLANETLPGVEALKKNCQ